MHTAVTESRHIRLPETGGLSRVPDESAPCPLLLCAELRLLTPGTDMNITSEGGAPTAGDQTDHQPRLSPERHVLSAQLHPGGRGALWEALGGREPAVTMCTRKGRHGPGLGEAWASPSEGQQVPGVMHAEPWGPKADERSLPAGGQRK